MNSYLKTRLPSENLKGDINLKCNLPLEFESKLVKNKREVLIICKKAYQRCLTTGELFNLKFPGFSIKFQCSEYASDDGKPRLILETNSGNLTFYTPNDELSAIDFLDNRIKGN